MSYPSPNNPYAQHPYGQPPYGQQPPQGQPGHGYGYPQQAAQPGGYPTYPTGAGTPPTVSRMPGQVTTARVLLFVAGGLWTILALILIFGGFIASRAIREVADANLSSGGALGISLVGLLVGGGMAALHIVPAALFGKGGPGTRVAAIIAGSFNALIPLIGLAGLLSQNNGNPFFAILWAGTAVVTVVFCSLNSAAEWFKRPRY